MTKLDIKTYSNRLSCDQNLYVICLLIIASSLDYVSMFIRTYIYFIYRKENTRTTQVIPQVGYKIEQGNEKNRNQCLSNPNHYTRPDQQAKSQRSKPKESPRSHQATLSPSRSNLYISRSYLDKKWLPSSLFVLGLVCVICV